MPNTPERAAASDALAQAQQLLLEHLWALQRSDDSTELECELASALVDVVDYGRRVLVGPGNCYQAEKSSYLLAAADRIDQVLAESIGVPA